MKKLSNLDPIGNVSNYFVSKPFSMRVRVITECWRRFCYSNGTSARTIIFSCILLRFHPANARETFENVLSEVDVTLIRLPLLFCACVCHYLAPWKAIKVVKHVHFFQFWKMKHLSVYEMALNKIMHVCSKLMSVIISFLLKTWTSAAS